MLGATLIIGGPVDSENIFARDSDDVLGSNDVVHVPRGEPYGPQPWLPKLSEVLGPREWNGSWVNPVSNPKEGQNVLHGFGEENQTVRQVLDIPVPRGAAEAEVVLLVTNGLRQEH